MITKTYILTIGSMHCSSCALTIDMDIEELPGVQKVATHYAKSQTVVTFDPAKVTLSKIKQKITLNGYTIEAEKEIAPPSG